MFCYIFERIFLVTTIFGKHKSCSRMPLVAMGPTNLISLFYKLVCQDPQYPNDNIATGPKYSSKKRHIGMCQ